MALFARSFVYPSVPQCQGGSFSAATSREPTMLDWVPREEAITTRDTLSVSHHTLFSTALTLSDVC